ncbi:MAG: HlyD family secretion protein [Bryobacteraceae bacterium]|nr:HlyD family secretion protein [Bryobacteraceae bacterium]
MKTTLEPPVQAKTVRRADYLVELVGMDRLPALDQVPSPPSISRLAWSLAGLLAALMIGLGFVPWQQSVTGDGRVIAYTPDERHQLIAAPVEGRVVKSYVIEGTHVRKGDPLFEISDNDPTILDNLKRDGRAVLDRLNAAQGRVDAIRGQILALEGSRRNSLESASARIQAAVEQAAAAERFQEAAESNLFTARLNLERTKNLNQKGLRSTRDLELAQNDFDRHNAELARAKNSLNAARNNQQALEAERQRIENDFRSSIESARALLNAAQGDVANAKSAEAQISIRINRQLTQEVVAPRDGTVFRLLAQPGSQLLKAGDPVVELVPDSDAQTVELKVKGNDMPLIAVGAKVRLQFEGWPAVQFVGWPAVAVGTFGGVVKLIDATDDGMGNFRLLIGPDPEDKPWPSKMYLRQGVRANGWVLLRVVPLGFELWRQFNGFPPTIAQDEPGATGVSRPEKKK